MISHFLFISINGDHLVVGFISDLISHVYWPVVLPLESRTFAPPQIPVVKTVPINRQALSSKVQGPKPERSRAGVGYLGDSKSPPPPESGLGSAVRTPSGDWGGAPEEVLAHLGAS